MKNLTIILFISLFTLQTMSNKAAVVRSSAVMNDMNFIHVLDQAEVYPNPAEDHIFLKINDQNITSEVKIEVMSIIGNKMSVTHEKIESGLYKIDLTNISTGHYYVMLTIDSDKSLKKFIKR
jgi:predicted nuclease of restriction endonuclease-like RecB superfamily